MILVAIIILLIISIYVNINMLRKLEDAEEKYIIVDNERKKLEEFLMSLSDKIKKIDKRIRELDYRGSFEADDEIGFFFKEVKKLNDELKQYI